MSNVNKLFALGLVMTGACVVSPEDQTAESGQEIIGGSAASQFQLDRAVKIPGCTATRISPRWAITALHCDPKIGDIVSFYTTGPGVSSLQATVDLVVERPGTSPTACGGDWPWNCDDSTGLFADVALLRLKNIPTMIDGTSSTPATLAWAFPGDSVAGVKVGAGNHNGAGTNTNGTLLQVGDTIDDTEDNSGDFWTTTDNINKGDSGGPFYVDGRILGTLWGTRWDPLAAHYDLYTSIPKHLDWILQTIGYEWQGAPSQANTTYQGTLIQSLAGTERMCQYACDHTQSCQAYNSNTTSCGLYTNVTGASTQSGWRGALHYGSATGQSNEVVGYRRNDGWNAVLHKATDGSIHELVFGSSLQWFAGTIQPPGFKPIAGKLSAYRRTDGKNAIVYRSTDGSVMEIRLDGGWKAKQINANLPTASGDPTAFVRADGVSAVVYRSGTRIIELRLLSDDSFAATDLTAAANVTSFAASSDPSPTVRADGLTSVVYRSNGSIVELFRRPGETWQAGVPSGLATHIDGGFPTTIPPAVSRPYASTRRDGRLAILYRSNSNNLIELTLESTGWKWDVLVANTGLNAAANPVQYVRTDVVESAVYRNSSGAVYEVARTPSYVHVPGQLPPAYNLSASYSVIGAVTTDPQVYLRNDNVNAIVYGLLSNRVGELSYERGVGWASDNLTFSSGETP